MIEEIICKYKKGYDIITKKPVLLWGLTLLAQLLCALAFPLSVLPIIALPISWTLLAGLCGLYLKGCRGDEIKTDDIFTGFKDIKQFKRVACGMAWATLWVFLWALIPVVGIVLALIKALEYSFVPYILLEKPELSPTEALTKSREMTCGYKMSMFLSQLFLCLAMLALLIALAFLTAVPYFNVIFVILLIVAAVLLGLLYPFLWGLIHADYYYTSDRARTPMLLPSHEPVAPVVEEPTEVTEVVTAEEPKKEE